MLDGLSGQIADSYAARTGRSADDFKALMDKETWFTAKAAVEAGLADEVMFADEDSLSMVASMSDQLSPEALAKGRVVMAMDENKTVAGDHENTVGNMAVTIDGAEIAQLVAEALQPYQEALDNLKSQEQEPEAKKPTGFLF